MLLMLENVIDASESNFVDAIPYVTEISPVKCFRQGYHLTKINSTKFFTLQIIIVH